MEKDGNFWSPTILGMHDALVSSLGLIAGMVFADGHQYTIILTVIIAASAAALSMAASEYLACCEEFGRKYAIHRGIATGVAYLFTVGMLVVPFVFISHPFVALTMTYVVAISIIFFFNYVKSKLKQTPFWRPFAQMLIICFVVTFAAFLIGECAKLCWGIEI